MRKTWTAAAMVGAIAAGALTAAQPAAATTAHGCEWPRVCFYLYESDWNRNAPTASFQDLGYWQTLGSRSASASFVYNSRNDDGARLRFEDGNEWCLRPNRWEQLQPVYTGGAVSHLKIMDSATC